MALMIFDKKKLAPGTMNDFIFIQERSLTSGTIGGTGSVPSFNTIWQGMTKFEIIKPTFRMEGVNIPAGTTHIDYMPFDSTVFNLDGNKFFIKRPSKRAELKDRYYKLLGKINYGEQDEYLLLFIQETGFVDVESAKI